MREELSNMFLAVSEGISREMGMSEERSMEERLKCLKDRLDGMAYKFREHRLLARHETPTFGEPINIRKLAERVERLEEGGPGWCGRGVERGRREEWIKRYMDWMWEERRMEETEQG